MDSTIIILVSGTITEAKIKQGFNFFPRIYIPKGTAKISAPINLKELKDAIDGSLKPCFLR